MPIFKKSTKKRGKFDFLGFTVFSPVSNLVEAAVSTKNALYDHIEYIKNYLRGANILRKDLYSANISLAAYHLQNNHVFDAKFRYYVAHFLRKKSTEPLLGLAEIAIIQKKIPKAKKYFQKTLAISQSTQEQEEIQSIIENL